MKTTDLARKSILCALCAGMLLTAGGCSTVQRTWNSMTQAGQGATAGGALGAAAGTGVGALIGGGKGTWIGALVGGALGAGTGALIGRSMDKQKADLEKDLQKLKQEEDIAIEKVKDSNNLDAIKLVMGSSVLFPTNSSTLSAEADAALSKVAYNLKQYPETDITVVGYTDNTGSEQLNQNLSEKRAESVEEYLESQGIPASRMKAVGMGEKDPVAPNNTAAGRAQNRRVELFITANHQMIQNAETAAK